MPRNGKAGNHASTAKAAATAPVGNGPRGVGLGANGSHRQSFELPILLDALEAMRIADKLGSPFFRSGACLAFGHAHILAAKWAEARGALEEAVAIARAGQAAIETEALAQ